MLYLRDVSSVKTREEALELALKSCRAWAQHWDEDRKCNLPVTDTSVASCIEEIDLALNFRPATDKAA